MGDTKTQRHTESMRSSLHLAVRWAHSLLHWLDTGEYDEWACASDSYEDGEGMCPDAFLREMAHDLLLYEKNDPSGDDFIGMIKELRAAGLVSNEYANEWVTHARSLKH